MELLKFKDKQDIDNIILELAQTKRQVVYGAQSVNIQLPKHLRKKTSDYDILTKKPKQSAEELATLLKRELGKEFKVEQSKFHPQTFKVKDIQGNTIADYTRTTKKPKNKIILGIRYANLEYQKSKIKKILKDEASRFRYDKDIETLQRIRKGEINPYL